MIVCVAGIALLTSYRKLNRAKFAVLAEMESGLPVPPFTRERQVCRRDHRRSLSQVERWIPVAAFSCSMRQYWAQLFLEEKIDCRSSA